MTSKENAEQIAQILEDKKAEDVQVLHVGDKTIVADYFVICSGHSVPHVKTLCDEVDEKVKERGLDVRKLRTDGYNDGHWIVMDYGNVLVHIFHPDEREYYNLERLWS